jgi:ABC-type transporter Mla maintaining outer membrane lipid asymmetry permease subunit MlaE
MTEAVAAQTTQPAGGGRGLLARAIGTIVSPGETFADVAARPRVLGMLALVLAIMIACQVAFLLTDIGKQALLDQQVKAMEGFGMTVTDQMYSQMESRLSIAPWTTAGSQLVFIPLVGAIIAGLLMGVFNALLDGKATFKQVYAIVIHSSVIIALSTLFGTPISYMQGKFTSASRLSVFVPFLEEESFLVRFLGGIDLKKKTGPIATSLIGIYVTIVLVIAAIRSF